MRRTYILGEKKYSLPWKDRKLTFFILVRIMCLKEKGQNIGHGIRSPLFHRFYLVVSYVYLQFKVFT